MSKEKTPTCVNITKATGEELQWLANHKCKHGHNFASHFNCFLTAHHVKERVGALDIETSNLSANFGIMLSWAIQEVGEDHCYYDVLTLEDLDEGQQDKRIVETCIETMRMFDRVVGHFAVYFDIPFIRTRALHHGLDFPKHGEVYLTDTWRMAKKLLKLNSNRQDTVAEILHGKTIKTRINPTMWAQVQFGKPKERQAGLDYILEHNFCDVLDLEANYTTLLPYYKETRSSI